MGRLLKRVPMDFDWPVNHTWKGYICPYRSMKCVCDGTGYNPETKKIADDFYDFNETSRRWVDAITQDELEALRVAGRLRDGLTLAQVNAINSSGGGGFLGGGHDAINRSILIETRAKRLGVWGLCALCDGNGSYYATLEIEALTEAWEPTDPPTGDGYQLWENTSEGSPISPVFATLKELCAWAAENASTFADVRASAEEWETMLSECDVRHESVTASGVKLVFS